MATSHLVVPLGQNPLTISLSLLLASLSPADRASISGSGAGTLSSVTDFTSKLHETKHKRARAMARRVEPFLRAIQQFSGAIDVMAQSSQVASLLWGGVKIVVTISFNLIAYAEKISEMFSQLGVLCPVYERFETLFAGSIELRDALYRFYAGVVNFCWEVLNFTQSRSNRFKVFRLKSLWKTLEPRFENIEKDLEEKLKLVNLEIAYASQRAQAENRQRIVAYQNEGVRHRNFERDQWRQNRDWQLQKAEDQAKIDWEDLLTRLCSYNHVFTFLNLKNRRAKNTGTWLLNTKEYIAWTNSTASAGLWCHGIPGSGKSILTAVLIDHLLNSMPRNTLLCYFFCTFSDYDSLQARTLFTSLTKQILTIMGRGVPGIEKLVGEAFDRDRLSPLDDRSCADLLLDIISKSKSRFYVIVDGIDECKDREKYMVLSLLNKLAKEPNAVVKCLLSSRWEAQAPTALQEFATISVTAERNSCDIITYIETEIQERMERGSLNGFTDDLLQRITNTLTRNAKAMFLLVHYQLEEILRQNDERSITSLLDHIPRRLHELFDRIIRRIESEKDGVIAGKVFRWILFARRPLTIDELVEAVSIKFQDADQPGDTSWSSINFPLDKMKLAQNCGPLIIVNENDKTVTLAHYAVKEFLITTEPSSCRNSSFFFDIERGNLELGAVCLTYLNLSEFETALTVPQPEPATENPVGSDISIPFSASEFIPLAITSGSRAGFFLSHLSKRKIARRQNRADKQRQSTRTARLYNPAWVIEPSKQDDGPAPFPSEFPLFEYATENWLYHCKLLDEQSISWALFQKTIENSNMSDLYLPWAGDPPRKPRIPDFPPNLPAFIWAVDNDCPALIRYVMLQSGLRYVKYCAFELDSKNAYERAARAGSLGVLQFMRGGLHETKIHDKPAHLRAIELMAIAIRAGNVAMASFIYEEFCDFLDYEQKGFLLALAARRHLTTLCTEILTEMRGKKYGKVWHQPFQQEGEISNCCLFIVLAFARGGNPEIYKYLRAETLFDWRTGQLPMGSKLATIPNWAEDDFTFDSPLEAAVAGGSEQIVQDMLLVVENSCGTEFPSLIASAMRLAASQSSLPVFELLYSVWSRLQEETTQGDVELVVKVQGCLSAAVRGGNIGIVKLAKCKLLDSHLDACTPKVEGEYHAALMEATLRGRLDILKALLPLQENLALRIAFDKIHRHEFVLWAVQGGNIDVLRFILSNIEAPIRKITSRDFTKKIHCEKYEAAASIGSVEILKLLLQDDGSSLKSFKAMRPTLLSSAARGGHIEMTKYLLSHGFDPNERDRARKPAIVAASEAGHLEVVELLVHAGAKLAMLAKSRFDFHPSYALRHPPASLLEGTIDAVATAGHAAILKILIDTARAEGVPVWGQPPNIRWKLICKKGYFEVLKILLENELRDESYHNNHTCVSCLKAAVDGGYYEMVEFLLPLETRLDSSFFWGLSKYAKKKGYILIARLLEEAHYQRQEDEHLRLLRSLDWP